MLRINQLKLLPGEPTEHLERKFKPDSAFEARGQLFSGR